MFFLLVIIGMVLILLNVKAIKKEDNSFSSVLKREKEMEQIKASIVNINDKLTENYSKIIETDDIINNNIANNSRVNNGVGNNHTDKRNIKV